MKKILVLFLVMATLGGQQIFAQINSLSVTPNSAQTCDSATVLLSGNHFCPNDAITSISHSVSGNVITVQVSMSFGFCIPPIPPPSFNTSYTFSLSALPVGSYMVRAYYDTQLSSSTDSIDVVTCCPNQAYAGNDTSLCDASSFQLNANVLVIGGTGSWTIINGSGTLSNSSQPNAVLNNPSFGMNTLVWTTADSICTTRDTIEITNYQDVGNALTEADRMICEDTTTVHANAALVGSGQWTPLSLGILYPNGNTNPNALAKFIFPGNYTMTWTLSNGACMSVDTLQIEYAVLGSPPFITESNFVLTSSQAPKYQWYKDGSPINGANSQSYTATSNGIYKVLASLSTCESGLFSNEIEILSIGIPEFEKKREINIYPNPASQFCSITGLHKNEVISLYDFQMKWLRLIPKNDNKAEINLSDLAPGLYFIRIHSALGEYTKKLLVEK